MTEILQYTPARRWAAASRVGDLLYLAGETGTDPETMQVVDGGIEAQTEQVFANIRSPGTLANLRQNANVEVNVVDPFVRKGYRFKGIASILESGPLYDKLLAFYKDRGSQSAIREIVIIRVQTAQPIDSPAYDLGFTEDQVRDRWDRYFQSLRSRKPTSQTGE